MTVLPGDMTWTHSVYKMYMQIKVEMYTKHYKSYVLQQKHTGELKCFSTRLVYSAGYDVNNTTIIKMTYNS